MVKVMGIEFAPLHVPLERRLQTASALFLVTFALFGGLSGLFLWVFLLFTPYYWISLLYLPWYVYDFNACHRGGRPVKWVRTWRVWKHFRNYFPVKLIKTADLDPKRNYLIGCHPHGAISAGAISNFLIDNEDFNQLFPNMKPCLFTLQCNFWFPFYRDFLNTVGIYVASREGIAWLLSREGTGNAAALVIGGTQEAMETHSGNIIKLTLRRRKGFVKLALKNGAGLVPMFSFGEHEIYGLRGKPDGSLLQSLQSMRYFPPILNGRGVFQYSVGLVPHRRPITTVVGKPIDLEKVENPTQERIDEVHAQYIQSLQELFEENKAKYGASDLQLVIK